MILLMLFKSSQKNQWSNKKVIYNVIYRNFLLKNNTYNIQYSTNEFTKKFVVICILYFNPHQHERY